MTTKEAIKLLKFVIFMVEEQYATEEIEEALEMAIKALHDRPSGKWIIKYDAHSDIPIREYYCDQCGKRGGLGTMLFDDKPLPNFCGNCGAEMKGGADD